MGGYYDRLGDILSDRLANDDDPFETWEPNPGKIREAGNSKERVSNAKKKIEIVRTDVPEELLADYRTLNLPAGAGAEDCKASWKRLLKKHHPDLVTGGAPDQERATRMTTKINDSYKRIQRWLEATR